VDDPGGPEADDGDDDAGVGHHLEIDVAGRLDAVVAGKLAELSRAQVQRLIDEGLVRVGGIVVTKAGHRLRAGDVVDVVVPPAEPLELLPEPIPLAIVFEDADLIVVDKPAGLVVHPAAGHSHGTLVNALLFHCKDLSGIGGVLRPGIVHRLDRDTTGVMVATKSERAHAALTAGFAAKSSGVIRREYTAIAAPPPPAPAGTLRTLYNRHPVDRKRFSSKVAAGKPAITHWETVETLRGAAIVRLKLETGRTHQIRVHAADHGWPLVGDKMYGGRPRFPEVAAKLGRQALHATLLELDHPATGARMRFEAPLPADMAEAIAALR
jgi:23S rRNA pseudouridine1911/1915/1917 synthase